MAKIKRPVGAIETLAEVKALIERAKTGERVVIYEVLYSTFYANRLCVNSVLDDSYLKNVCVTTIKGVEQPKLKLINLSFYDLDEALRPNEFFLFSNYWLARAYFMRSKNGGKT